MCGREPGGIQVQELGICPATTEVRINNINNGKNGGRSCWALTGTLCGGIVQSSLLDKLDNCFKCEFYATVYIEERRLPTYKNIIDIQHILGR